MIVSSNTGSNPNNRSVVICISGLAGTGKSTVARKLAKEFCLKYYSGGDALKALASDEGYDTSKPGWWESPVGLEFLMQRQGDSKFDEAIDRRLLEYAKQGNVLFDSWTMPWLVKDGFKVWLLASLEKRAERVAKRDGLSVQEALDVLKEKEERTRAIYEKLYGFSLGEDFNPFDMILDTEKLDAAEVFQILCQVITKMVLEKQNFSHQ